MKLLKAAGLANVGGSPCVAVRRLGRISVMDEVLRRDRLMWQTILFTTPCNVVQLSPDYVYTSECNSVSQNEPE